MNSTLSTALPGQDLLPRILGELDPEFADRVAKVFAVLLTEGVVMRAYSGVRSPLEQAVLWCQSRTPLEHELMARRLDEDGAGYLARVIRRAARISTPGRWATNNLPGQSWHNFGQAVDSHVVSEDGRAVWGPKHPSYVRYAEVARELGLFPGYDFGRQDVVHVQGPMIPVRSAYGPWREVDAHLAETFPSDGLQSSS